MGQCHKTCAVDMHNQLDARDMHSQVDLSRMPRSPQGASSPCLSPARPRAQTVPTAPIPSHTLGRPAGHKFHTVPLSRVQCGICLDLKNMDDEMLKTMCCDQWMCHHCAACDAAYKQKPRCPYCRQEGYKMCTRDGVETVPTGVQKSGILNGTWDVRIEESSKVGSSSYNVTLKIEDGAALYVSEDDHFENAKWKELAVGHTKSGKSFVAKQVIRQAPTWAGDGAKVYGNAGLQGSLDGPDSANFTTSMKITGERGEEELEIIQRGTMRRRTV